MCKKSNYLRLIISMSFLMTCFVFVFFLLIDVHADGYSNTPHLVSDGGTLHETETYYYPEGFPKVNIIKGYNNVIVFFTQENDVLYGNRGTFSANDGNGMNTEYYYFTQSNIWSALNALKTPSTLESLTHKNAGETVGDLYYYSIVGEFDGTMRTGFGGSAQGETLQDCFRRYYSLGKPNEFDDGDNYNRPFFHGVNGEYIIFKRSGDANYTLLFYSQINKNSYEFDGQFTIGSETSNPNGLVLNSDAKYLQFSTVDDAKTYLFQNTEVSEKTTIYDISSFPSLAGNGSSIRIINGFDENCIIYKSTLPVVKSGTTIKEEDKLSYDDWYYEENGEHYNPHPYNLLDDVEAPTGFWGSLVDTMLNEIAYGETGIIYDDLKTMINYLGSIFTEDYSRGQAGLDELGVFNITLRQPTQTVDFGNDIIGEWTQTYTTGTIDYGLSNQRTMDLSWFFGYDDIGHVRGVKYYSDLVISGFIWLVFGWYLWHHLPEIFSGELSVADEGASAMRSHYTGKKKVSGSTTKKEG